MKPYLEPLGKALGHLQQATMWFMQNAMTKPDNAGRRLDRLHASLRPGRARLHVGADGRGGATQKLANGAERRDRSFYENKLVTGRFFMERMMPETATHLAASRPAPTP